MKTNKFIIPLLAFALAIASAFASYSFSLQTEYDVTKISNGSGGCNNCTSGTAEQDCITSGTEPFCICSTGVNGYNDDCVILRHKP